MPFKRIRRGKHRGKYRSPSGRVYSSRQVRLYYLTKGFTKMGRVGKVRRRRKR
jgi:hypothetical protein